MARRVASRTEAHVQYRWAGAGAIGVLCGASAALTAWGPRQHPLVTLGVAVGSVVAVMVLLGLEAADRPLGRSVRCGAMVAVSGLLVFAVVTPPRGSRDVWMYATYGRMIEHRHVSPYVTTPAQILAQDRRAGRPRDAILGLSAPQWRRVGSVYGPAFLGVSALWMRIAGPSPLLARLGFQGLAAVAVIFCLALLHRRRAPPAGIVLVGCHPLVVAWVVNGGHADAAIGALLLVCVVCAERGRIGVAAVAGGLAAGIKATAGLGVLGLIVWVWRRHGWRRAFIAALTAGAVVGGPLVVAGGTEALRPLLAARTYASRSTPWQFLSWVIGRPAVPGPWVFGLIVLVGLGLALLAVRGARQVDEAVAAPLVAFVLLAPYALPWYGFWALPALAGALRSLLSRAMFAIATWQVFTYAYVPRRPGWTNATFHAMALGMGGFEALVIGLVLVTGFVRPGRPRPEEFQG